MAIKKSKQSGRESREATSGSIGTPVRFRTTLNQAEGKNATGIIIPDNIIARLGHGKRPPVRITVNGYEYRSTVGVMGGRAMIGVSAAIRNATGLAAGDQVHVELVVDASSREITLPTDFARALAASRGTRDFFNTLPNSLQRFHIDNINSAKSDDTRQRRIEKAVALFRAGKKR